jgi:hypothetical protein
VGFPSSYDGPNIDPDREYGQEPGFFNGRPGCLLVVLGFVFIIALAGVCSMAISQS